MVAHPHKVPKTNQRSFCHSPSQGTKEFGGMGEALLNSSVTPKTVVLKRLLQHGQVISQSPISGVPASCSLIYLGYFKFFLVFDFSLSGSLVLLCF